MIAHRGRIVGLGILVMVLGGGARAADPSGKWVGQDGHDLVGTSSVVAPSDVQDIHIRLSGLPAGREIVSGVIRPLGGGEWFYKGPQGPAAAALVRPKGATTADLYLEPYQVETGRPFQITLQFADRSQADFWVKGGRADPNLRMPGAALKVVWNGQGDDDRTGAGPSVGPDGVRDAKLTLSRLSPGVEIRAVALDAPGLTGWQFGANPEGWNNAELIRRPDDPTTADLFINPVSDLAGVRLTLRVQYANGKTDRAEVVASRTDPNLRVPRPDLPELLPNAIRTRWLGQDEQKVVGPGDVHVVLDGLPKGREIVAAALSNVSTGHWVFRRGEEVPFHAEPYAWPMAVRQDSADPSRADLFFPPHRDETGGTMTLSLVFRDGARTVVRFEGGASDLALRSGPGPDRKSVRAKPGDDLNDLASRFGTVTLAPGTYTLTRPLVLNRSVTIQGEPGAIVRFAQNPDEAPWTSAIKIHVGRTTLEGFAVRFAGPVRWNHGISYGPAVIGSTDNLDPDPHDPKCDVRLIGLDLEGPPSSGKAPWEEAVRLARLVTATSGRIERNRLKGGAIEIFGGPWRIVGNDFRGTPPGQFSPAVFGAHATHDLILQDNTARAEAPCGKTWRFLVMTVGGNHDLVQGNRVEGVGPRDDDTIPSANAPEIILTESYRLHFEGKPLAVSTDGRIVRIPEPQGGPAGTGDALAILSGEGAGTWRRVAQVIDPTTYLVDPPLPKGVEAISLATGFLDETFQDNRLDTRGGAAAANLVLVGNHYGTRIIGNHLIGAGEAFKITAAPTEAPGPWGWSHAPFLGGIFQGNIIEDAPRGGTLSVEHGEAIKSSRGRVYMSILSRENVVRFGDEILKGTSSPPPVTIGDPGALDADELVITIDGDRGDASQPVPLQVHAARLNGREIRDKTYVLRKE